MVKSCTRKQEKGRAILNSTAQEKAICGDGVQSLEPYTLVSSPGSLANYMTMAKKLTLLDNIS